MIGSESCKNVCNKNKDDDIVSDIMNSEPESSHKFVSKPSPLMGSVSCHKVRNKNKDDKNDADVED